MSQYATINVGHAIPVTGGEFKGYTVAHEIRRAFFGFDVADLRTVRVEGGEPTTVFTVRCSHYSDVVGRAYMLAVALHQDCVALSCGDQCGLIGPNAAAWGEFDESKFLR